jgi:hypothetical protein
MESIRIHRHEQLTTPTSPQGHRRAALGWHGPDQQAVAEPQGCGILIPGGLAVSLESGHVLDGGTSSASAMAEARAEFRCGD